MEKDLEGFKIFLLEKELSQGTIQNYLHAVRKYFESYPELTKSNVLDWKLELAQTLGACTVNARLIAIKSYAAYKGMFIPVKAVKIQKIFSTSNIITDEQYTRLMDGL